VIYRIDRNDALVYADGAFRRFAASVGEPDLGERMLGQSLWDFIGDPELSALHLALISRARQGHEITIRTRCDSENVARSIEITFAPQEDGAVELCCRLAGAELLNLNLPPSGEQAGAMLRLCAWCYRAERDGWRDIEEVVTAEHLLERPRAPIITHGICEDCLAELHAELDAPAAVS
jgi:hypothetical protein